MVLDPDQFTTQAALFTRRAAKLIRPLNNEFASGVRLLSDSRIAFVDSFDSESNRTQYLTRRGQASPLDFGPDPADQFAINDRGRISGTSFTEGGGRAFR